MRVLRTNPNALGEIILLENLRFHIEEEGSVKDKEGNKVILLLDKNNLNQERLTRVDKD